MKIQQAIEKAKKGWWKPKKDWHYEDRSAFGVENIIWDLNACFLDPLFWQSLGKAMGWIYLSDTPEHWKKEWHRFIDHLAEGKDAESFFESL